MTFEEICEYLKTYDGRKLIFMEVCGSHTAAIAKFGIRDMLSDRIRLVSGPGCPVCVTPSAYIDKLIELAETPGYCVASFGDMLRVPGSKRSLSEAKGDGAKVTMVYSPMDVLKLAEENPKITYVFAAVGFETTAPVYTLLLEEALKRNLSNIRLLTSLKTMPRAIRWLLDNGAQLDGFLAPGHVCAITGSSYFSELAAQYRMPFAVSGFGDRELMIALYGLVKMAKAKESAVRNFYPAVVEQDGNRIALDKLKKFFSVSDTVWRGMGEIKGSGLILREEYKNFDAGSTGLVEDIKRNEGCCCGKILMGRMEPADCPLFGTACTPAQPQGACMVSLEGSCHQQYINGET